MNLISRSPLTDISSPSSDDYLPRVSSERHLILYISPPKGFISSPIGRRRQLSGAATRKPRGTCRTRVNFHTKLFFKSPPQEREWLLRLLTPKIYLWESPFQLPYLRRFTLRRGEKMENKNSKWVLYASPLHRLYSRSLLCTFSWGRGSHRTERVR